MSGGPGNAYGTVAIGLHWLVAAGVVAAFSVGFTMVDLPFSPTRLTRFSIHKWIGVSVFAVMLLRLAWRLGHTPPPLPPGLPRWQGALAGAVHALMYALLLAIPLTGWLYSSASGVPTVPFGLSALQLPDLVDRDRALADVLRFVHRSLNYSLATLAGLHVAGVLFHQLAHGPEVLSRMLPGTRP